MFQNYAVLDPDIEIRVMKVVLVYDIDEIVELEKKMAKLVEKKKRILLGN
jgi:hypothetical protein